MIVNVKINDKIYKSETHKYASLHRTIVNVYSEYDPNKHIIYTKCAKVCNHKDGIYKYMKSNESNKYGDDVNSNESTLTFEVVPKLKGGIEVSKSTAKSGMFYFILFLVTLSPIYFMYVGIVPLKSFLSRRILTTALEPLGKYLVCVLGKKTLYSRLILGTSIIKYFIFIFAVFVTFTLPFIILCILMGVFMKHNTLMDSPSKLEGPVKAGYTSGVVFTMVHMIIYFGYRWFDYFADFFISLFNKNYYTRMIFIPILEIMKSTFNNLKGTGAIIATGGYAMDVKGYTAAAGAAASAIESIMHIVVKEGCEAVGVDQIESEFKKALRELKGDDLKKFEIKGRDRKKFCFDFNEYLDENDYERLCTVAGNEQCCTSSMFYKIAMGMQNYLVKGGGSVAETVKKVASMVGLMGHLITANIAFFEESMERDDAFDDRTGDAIYLLERQMMIKGSEQNQNEQAKKSGIFVYESDIEAKSDELSKQGFKVQTLYDEKYRNYKENIVGVMNIKRKITFDEIRNNINELKRMLNDYNASYSDEDVIVKYVFKPYFISNVCEALNGMRATRDFSKDINGLDNAVDILRSGMFTGRWMIVFYLIAYLVLILLGFFKVYLK